MIKPDKRPLTSLAICVDKGLGVHLVKTHHMTMKLTNNKSLCSACMLYQLNAIFDGGKKNYSVFDDAKWDIRPAILDEVFL